MPLAQYRNLQLQDDSGVQPAQVSGSNGSAVTAPQPPLLLPYSGQDRQVAGRLMAQLLARDVDLSTQLLTIFLRSSVASQLGTGQAGLANLDLCASNVTAQSLRSFLQGASNVTGSGAAPGNSSSGSNSLGDSAQGLSQLMANLGAVLGTSAPTSPTNLVEPAFVEGSAALDTQSGSASSNSFGLPSGAGGGAQGSSTQEVSGQGAPYLSAAHRAAPGCTCVHVSGMSRGCAQSLALHTLPSGLACTCARPGSTEALGPPHEAVLGPTRTHEYMTHDTCCPCCLTQVRPLYYLAPDCGALPPGDARVLAQLGCALGKLAGVALQCASAQPQWRPDLAGLAAEVYCGWRGSGCVASDSSGSSAGVRVQDVRLSTDQVGGWVQGCRA